MEKHREKVAVIDLGTNTFNLIIAETGKKEFIILESRRIPVKLGKHGIHKNILKADALKRGIKALEKHMEVIKQHNITKIASFGTSALRGALNRQEFIDEIKNRFGFEVEIISGDREAELIYKGVRLAVELSDQPILILDIGGGSNELIIANQEKIFWKKSYDLGIARLLELFSIADPISEEDIRRITTFLKEELSDFFEVMQQYDIHTLIGASGSFETFASMILFEKYGTDDILNQYTKLELFIEDFKALYQKLLASNLSDRKKMKGLPLMRVEMIVLSSLFTDFILQNCNIGQLLFSAYALKEGVISELTA